MGAVVGQWVGQKYLSCRYLLIFDPIHILDATKMSQESSPFVFLVGFLISLGTMNVVYSPDACYTFRIF
jgi:hypothetical protein